MQNFRSSLFAVLVWSSVHLLSGFQSGAVKGNATSLSEARDAVEANLRTPEGKAYDQQMGTDFVQKHLGPLRECKQKAADDKRSFWILLKLDGDGNVKEVLYSPETSIATCARDGLLKERLLPPPHPAYWASVYLKIAH